MGYGWVLIQNFLYISLLYKYNTNLVSSIITVQPRAGARERGLWRSRRRSTRALHHDTRGLRALHAGSASACWRPRGARVRGRIQPGGHRRELCRLRRHAARRCSSSDSWEQDSKWWVLIDILNIIHFIHQTDLHTVRILQYSWTYCTYELPIPYRYNLHVSYSEHWIRFEVWLTSNASIGNTLSILWPLMRVRRRT